MERPKREWKSLVLAALVAASVVALLAVSIVTRPSSERALDVDEGDVCARRCG